MCKVKDEIIGVEDVLARAIGDDYIADVSNAITDDVLKDIHETADKDYSDDDIRMAIGRVLTKRLTDGFECSTYVTVVRLLHTITEFIGGRWVSTMNYIENEKVFLSDEIVNQKEYLKGCLAKLKDKVVSDNRCYITCDGVENLEYVSHSVGGDAQIHFIRFDNINNEHEITR